MDLSMRPQYFSGLTGLALGSNHLFMFLKNYTSNVPVQKTVSRIEQLLAESGASNVSKTYSNGRIVSLMFTVDVNGKCVHFKMPADASAIFDAMWKDVRRPRKDTHRKLMEQSERTAWKLLQDSLEVECTRLKLRQTEFMQVFLSYVWNGKQTYYEALKDTNFRAMIPENV